MMPTIRRLSLVAPVLTAVLAAMVLIAIPAVPVRATDPPADPPPDSPPPSAPAYTVVREPAFNPATPLRGRVQLIDSDGIVVQQWVSDQPNDMLGLSAALVPDANGDGIADVAMSAPNAFDDAAGARVGTVRIASGADGSTIAMLSGTPIERFGLALYAPASDATAPQTVTVLVEHLDPSTGASYKPAAFTFRTFDALTGAILGEAVGAPAGFTTSAARATLATHIRATGPADLDADGGVTPEDFTILAANYGASVDPVTGALLEADPTLAATPTGDTNGDGVVDASDLLDVLTGFTPPPRRENRGLCRLRMRSPRRRPQRSRDRSARRCRWRWTACGVRSARADGARCSPIASERPMRMASRTSTPAQTERVLRTEARAAEVGPG
jgi:hypothetical protein